MGKLSTQPATAVVVPLRSGFFALPFDSATQYLYARVHTGGADEEDEDASSTSSSSKKLFVTGLPLGSTEKSLKSTFKQLYPSNKITLVELLPSSQDSSRANSLLSRELLAAASTSSNIDPLFPTDSVPSYTPSSSALITFTSTPSLPPASYASSTPLSLASAPSFLSLSLSTHSLARPHPSSIIAHSDTWMTAYDQRKLASVPVHYVPTTTAPIKLTATQRKKAAKAAKAAGSAPVPGSAAYALAQHQAEQARQKDRSHNPDEVEEGEWTLVTGGGKHGKSLLPTGVTPSIMGYGEGRTVKVAKGGKKGRGLLEEDDEDGEEGEGAEKMDQGVKKIVGDGFYSFVKNQQRRDDLTSLAAKFEQDKARLNRFRGEGGSSSGGRGRGGGFSRGGSRGGRGASRGGGGRGGGVGGREGRSFKPY
ncbi:hypothetical protein BCR35DRAFT_352451 [Leucosporidium creatinivorum]|uniref:Ribosomal RNA-processing protein 7 C-terminal domain-containing protein n=1 Tax=Leucosporidium creatinivorum TaxID=106004 RepID=A0A1Y2F9V2_9BASI|nr:hypothetical protein BCR35DRAFT_352451 [Leucosporidium creatinivorum]